MNKIPLTLYVTGNTSLSLKAMTHIKEICSAELKNKVHLKIIDVLAHPQLAEAKKILVTPTLVKETPPPTLRVLGDFSNKEKVLSALDLGPGIKSKYPLRDNKRPKRRKVNS